MTLHSNTHFKMEWFKSIRQTQQSQSISCVRHFEFGNDLFDLCWFLPKFFFFTFLSSSTQNVNIEWWKTKCIERSIERHTSGKIAPYLTSENRNINPFWKCQLRGQSVWFDRKPIDLFSLVVVVVVGTKHLKRLSSVSIFIFF